MTTILIIFTAVVIFFIIESILDHFFPDVPSCRIHGTEYMREKGYYGDTWCYKCWKEKKK